MSVCAPDGYPTRCFEVRTCMYVCMYMYVYMCMYMHVYMYTYIRTRISISLHTTHVALN